MTETVDVPKVGAVDKKVVGAIAVSVAGFVGYRYWQASRTGTVDDTSTTVASEFDAEGDPSTVLGAIRPNNDYGSGTAPDAPSTDDFGFHGTSNDAWTQYASAQLSQSDRWSYTDIVEALGKYLNQSPTSTAEQSIINAAVAVAGHPPVGSFTLIHAPTPIDPVTPATPTPTATAPATPTNLRVTSNTTSGFTVAWDPVPGASSYVVNSNGKDHTIGGASFTFAQFQRKTTYKVMVRAVGPTGLSSGNSAAVSVKTK